MAHEGLPTPQVSHDRKAGEKIQKWDLAKKREAAGRAIVTHLKTRPALSGGHLNSTNRKEVGGTIHR